MKQKLFLTSIIAMCFVAPAMAEMTDSSVFPNAANNEYMQENTRYINAATSTNMDGVYEGEVDAVAQYIDVLYQLAEGQYLPANSETPIDCNQNGYFCPGNSNGVYYSSSAQGLSECPTGYGNTATGASANTDCYRACTTTDITHSTAITGNVYYNGTGGDGTKVCTPTSCENGWHPKAATPDLTTLIGVSEAGVNSIENSSAMTFSVDYGNKGIVTGKAQCSTRDGTNPVYDVIEGNTTNILPDSSGDNCYCMLDGYTPTSNGTLQSVSSLWVFSGKLNFAGGCSELCTGNCAHMLQYGGTNNLAFRAGVFNTILPSAASCEANTITINWADVDPEYAGDNNEGTATYGGDINTPVKAATKPGKTFRGWKFVKPQQ